MSSICLALFPFQQADGRLGEKSAEGYALRAPEFMSELKPACPASRLRPPDLWSGQKPAPVQFVVVFGDCSAEKKGQPVAAPFMNGMKLSNMMFISIFPDNFSRALSLHCLNRSFFRICCMCFDLTFR